MWPILRPAWMASYLGTVPPVVSSIRQNPPEAEPTLDSIPQVDEPIIKDQPLSSIIRYMQEDGFHAWGFAVYRCAYVSALQWASYLEFLKEAVREYLEFDPSDLDSASKQHVRERFSRWAAAGSIERDGSGADDPWLQNRSRLKHCIYVHQRCLDAVGQYEAWVEQGAPSPLENVAYGNIDRIARLKGRGRNGYPSVEGCKKMDMGWMYRSLEATPEVYDRLSFEDLSKYDYPRLPGV